MKDYRFCTMTMNSQLLDDASKVIPDPQVLINVVSKRVKQLGAGSTPLVLGRTREDDLVDTALMEIIAGEVKTVSADS